MKLKKYQVKESTLAMLAKIPLMDYDYMFQLPEEVSKLIKISILKDLLIDIDTELDSFHQPEIRYGLTEEGKERVKELNIVKNFLKMKVNQ
jgi:hypothetical protein